MRGTSPVCNGDCPEGESCSPLPGYPFPDCMCVGWAPLCETSPFPTCDGRSGDCLQCRPAGSWIASTSCLYAPASSGCGMGSACGPGTYCLHGESGFFIYMLIPCAGGSSFPVCGGSCGEGSECHAWPLSGSSMKFCHCAATPVGARGPGSNGVACASAKFSQVSLFGGGGFEGGPAAPTECGRAGRYGRHRRLDILRQGESVS